MRVSPYFFPTGGNKSGPFTRAKLVQGPHTLLTQAAVDQTSVAEFLWGRKISRGLIEFEWLMKPPSHGGQQVASQWSVTMKKERTSQSFQPRFPTSIIQTATLLSLIRFSHDIHFQTCLAENKSRLFLHIGLNCTLNKKNRARLFVFLFIFGPTALILMPNYTRK